MRFCANCGQQIEENADVCPYCGHIAERPMAPGGYGYYGYGRQPQPGQQPQWSGQLQPGQQPQWSGQQQWQNQQPGRQQNQQQYYGSVPNGMPAYQQYYQPREIKKITKKFAIWPILGAAFAVAAWVFIAFIDWLTMPLGFTGIVFSLIGCRKKYKLNWMGIVGIPLSALAILSGSVSFVKALSDAVTENYYYNNYGTSYYGYNYSGGYETATNEMGYAEPGDKCSLGFTVIFDGLEITYSEGGYSSLAMYSGQWEYVFSTFDIENVSNETKEIKSSFFRCTADGTYLDTYDYYEPVSETLKPGEKMSITVYFSGGSSSSEIEFQYIPDSLSGEIIFFEFE